MDDKDYIDSLKLEYEAKSDKLKTMNQNLVPAQIQKLQIIFWFNMISVGLVTQVYIKTEHFTSLIAIYYLIFFLAIFFTLFAFMFKHPKDLGVYDDKLFSKELKKRGNTLIQHYEIMVEQCDDAIENTYGYDGDVYWDER